LVQTLGIEQLSKSQVSRMATELDVEVTAFRSRPLDGGPYTHLSLDAMTQKVRESGRIVNVAVVIAVGVNADGHREVLGFDVITSEDGAGWLTFLRGLVARGLAGTTLVISDAHVGLVDAVRSTLTGATSQRCRTHFMRNLLTRVPKSAQAMVATLVRTIFAQPDAASVWDQHTRVVEQLSERFAAAAELLAQAAPDVLAFTAFPLGVHPLRGNALLSCTAAARTVVLVATISATSPPIGGSGPGAAGCDVAPRSPPPSRRAGRSCRCSRHEQPHPRRQGRRHVEHRLAGGDQLLCQQRAEPRGRLDGPAAGGEAGGEFEQLVWLLSVRADSQLADHGLGAVEHRCGVGPLVGVDP
jgi:hypothetical protein